MSGPGHIFENVPFNTAQTPTTSTPLIFEVQSLPPIGGTTTSATTSLNIVGSNADGARVEWNANGTVTSWDNGDSVIDNNTNWFVINCGDVVAMVFWVDPDPSLNSITIYRNGISLGEFVIPNADFSFTKPFVQSGPNVHRDDPA